MRELGELLARVGVGYYRKIVDGKGVEIKGPYPTRNQANPYGSARLPFPLSVSSEFHLRRPKGTVAPDTIELEKIK